MKAPSQVWGGWFFFGSLLLAGIYAALWGVLDSLFYRTFSLHVWDVGANFVLTNMSAPPGLGYGHLTWAPQNLIYVFFIPIARAFPDPIVLVYAQDVLMALGGVFIFLIALKVWGRPTLALLLEGLYLFNYALFGAPFFPDHYEVLFSVLFPIAFFLYLTHRTPAASGVLVLSALCSSLAAVDAVLFVLLYLWPDILPVLRNRGRGLAAFVSQHRYPVVAGLASIGVFFIPFATVGFDITVSYSHVAGGTSPNVVLGLETSLATKLGFVLLLFLPFVPVLRRSRYVLLTVPFLLLVLLAGRNNYDQFSYQYAYTVGAILFIAFIDSLRTRFATPKDTSETSPSPSPSADSLSLRRLGRSLRKHRALLQVTAVVLVLGFLILPYSPGNAYAGPYASLPFRNYQFPSLITVTPYDQELWAMAAQVPMSDSVLIQENMPVLTNRAVWYEPGSYDGENVNYALTDPSTYWFVFHPPSFIGPYSIPMIQWVNELHENRSYGIAAEYQGAILFESGYLGAPSLFVPFVTNYPGTGFVGNGAIYHRYGGNDVSVTDARGNVSAFYTAGPLIVPPGSYSMTVELRSSSTSPSNRVMFGVWSNATAPVPVAVVSLTGSSFSTPDTWSRFTLDFSIGHYLQGVRFAAYQADWSGTLALDAAYLNQTSPV